MLFYYQTISVVKANQNLMINRYESHNLVSRTTMHN